MQMPFPPVSSPDQSEDNHLSYSQNGFQHSIDFVHGARNKSLTFIPPGLELEFKTIANDSQDAVQPKHASISGCQSLAAEESRLLTSYDASHHDA